MIYLIWFHIISAFFWCFYLVSLVSKDEQFSRLRKNSKEITLVFNLFIFSCLVLHLLGLWVFEVINFLKGKHRVKEHIDDLIKVAETIKNKWP